MPKKKSIAQQTREYRYLKGARSWDEIGNKSEEELEQEEREAAERLIKRNKPINSVNH